ncbi:CopD family protein [Bordetella genomosp. 13]|uniref:Protoporphyrinogen IX oxidase n=1 Tax=Bordetella genomosp. 13 TaxID=463040 RepID=A0A1W6ZH71_9BORD|nr:CopD family protein [Bordetella genomosp. 13]ARP96763.1 hypothetical protein CAL15_21795 [Bordetella genomosp. 13]
MTFITLYPWLKALHLAAALVFASGVLAMAGFLRMMPAVPGDMAVAVIGWDRWVTIPAMLLVWALGLGLASGGGWIGDGWLYAKLGLVLLLSAIHGVQSGQLRRSARGLPTQRWPAMPIIAASLAGIAILAVVKPF